ncbi:MAG: CDP-alcohol phosphatidyltransferase family protein [Acutalibacteraceae bacterium]
MVIIKQIANIITAARLVLSVPLIFTKPFSAAFYILYSLCGLSDMADGFIARRTNTESKTGEKLDSAADFLFLAVCFIKIIPCLSLPSWVWGWVGIIFAVRVVNIVIGFIRHGKAVAMHTLFNKITGLLLFLIPFFIPAFSVMYPVILTCVIATIACVHEGYLVIKDKE